MASPFFPNMDFESEQALFQDLSDEMIDIHGVEVFYIPRTSENVDKLYLQDPVSSFEDAIQITMYLKTFEGFQGDGDLMSKFGLSVADRMTMSVSKRTFEDTVGNVHGFVRPREGDLVYFPKTHGIFEIRFDEHEGVFYQAGVLTYHDLTLEKFSFNSETFDTGIDEIDRITVAFTEEITGSLLLSEDGASVIADEFGVPILDESSAPDKSDDILVQNDDFKDEANTILDWNASDPYYESGKQGN